MSLLRLSRLSGLALLALLGLWLWPTAVHAWSATAYGSPGSVVALSDGRTSVTSNYGCNHPGHPAFPERTYFAVYNSRGDLRWRVRDGDAYTVNVTCAATPVEGRNGVIYVAATQRTDRRPVLVAFSSTGEELWKYPLKEHLEGGRVNRPSLGVDAAGDVWLRDPRPVFGDRGQPHELVQLDPSSGTPKLRAEIPDPSLYQIPGRLVFSGSTVRIATTAGIAAFDRATRRFTISGPSGGHETEPAPGNAHLMWGNFAGPDGAWKVTAEIHGPHGSRASAALSQSDAGGPIYDAVPLADGGLAFVTDTKLVVINSDGSPRWSRTLQLTGHRGGEFAAGTSGELVATDTGIVVVSVNGTAECDNNPLLHCRTAELQLFDARYGTVARFPVGREQAVPRVCGPTPFVGLTARDDRLRFGSLSDQCTDMVTSLEVPGLGSDVRLSPSATTGSVCPDVQAIGVRGSRGNPTDPSPLTGGPVDDAQVSAFHHALGELVTRAGQTWGEPIWVRYPAEYVGWGAVSLFNRFRAALGAYPLFTLYPGGVSDGAHALKREVAAIRAACGGTTKIVLSGFSQGAHVIGQAIDTGLSSEQVAGVALMGDPTFSATNSGVTRYERAPWGPPRGGLGARGKPFPSSYNVYSYCKPADYVCGSVPRDGVDGHGNYDKVAVASSGRWWWYEGEASDPPTTQLARMIVRQTLDLEHRTSARPPEALGPVLVAPRRFVSFPGERVELSAALSYSPEGDALTYDWDVGADGTFEQSGPSPAFSWTFPREEAADVLLRVTDQEGRMRTTRISGEVSATAPRAPGAAQNATAVASDDGLVHVQWEPPESDGGLPTSQYDVEDAETGVLLATVDGAARSTRLEYATTGAITLIAGNEVRRGAPVRVPVTRRTEPTHAEPIPGGDQSHPALVPNAPLPALQPAGASIPSRAAVRLRLRARGRQFTVSIACVTAGARCRGAVRARARTCSGRRRLVGFGRRSFSVPPERIRSTTITLPRWGARCLARGKRMRIEVRLEGANLRHLGARHITLRPRERSRGRVSRGGADGNRGKRPG